MKISKLIHFRNGQRNWIRFNGKSAFIIEVFEIETDSYHKSKFDKLIADMKAIGLPAIHTTVYYDTQPHTLLITQFLKEYDDEHRYNYEKNLEYAASWYVNQCMRNNI